MSVLKNRFPLHRTRIAGCGCEKCAEDEAELAGEMTLARGRGRGPVLSPLAPLAPRPSAAARSRLAAATLGTSLSHQRSTDDVKVGGGILAALDPDPQASRLVKGVMIGLPILTGFLTAGPAGALLFGIIGYGNAAFIRRDPPASAGTTVQPGAGGK